jgi:hypothetical protein
MIGTETQQTFQLGPIQRCDRGSAEGIDSQYFGVVRVRNRANDDDVQRL